ncbi:MAG: transcription initiation factor TFIIIB [Nitrosopumilaceae archaeon]|nr:transcription initiation factor TFIIIB [Nitrosopumilaceae archaeon]
MVIKKRSKLITTNCDEHLFITDVDRGETVCKDCGIVESEKISDEGWGEYYVEDRNKQTTSRIGPSTTLTMFDKGLYTKISDGNKDSSGKFIHGKVRSSFDRLRKWDQRSKSEALSRNLGTAFTLLHGLKTKLAIPEGVLEKAAYLYRKAVAKKLTAGRSIAPFLAATLYIACRETNTPRSIDDIAKASNIRRTTVSRAIRITVKTLDLKLEQYDIEKFVSRMANDLQIKEKTKREALSILSQAKKIGLIDGKNPVAVASASLYLACVRNAESPNQTRISEISSISCVTIRNTTALIKKKLDL